MIKISTLVLALAVFLVIITLYIVPQQGGLTSSTHLQAEGLQGAKDVYQEQIPIQEVDLGSQGRSIFIALVMLTHVLFANLHLGGSWVAVLTESLYLKSRKPRFNRLARSITLFNVILFSAGATFAVGGVLFFISLFPVFSENMFHIYWWPLFLEALTFAFEIFFLYTYWFSWGKISNFWHQILGFSYAIDVFFQTLLINTMAGGMLTPGNDINWSETGILTMPWGDLLGWWNNPGLWFLQFHRLAAALSFFGFIVTALAMFHFMDRKDVASKRYWDWVGSYGLSWGLLGLIAQPGLGLMYMLAIQQSQPESFIMIMHGPRAWEMLLMMALFSSLVLTVLIYFIDRRERILTMYESRVVYALLRVFLVGAAISAIVLVSPSWLGATYRSDPQAWINPLGLMIYKYMALVVMIAIGSMVLMIDIFTLGDIKDDDWGNLPNTARISGIFAGILGMWIVITMGFVRESARSPWLVNNVIPVPGGQDYPTPISLWNIFAVWAVILAFTIIVFWFVSKVTAEHPEEAEEV